MTLPPSGVRQVYRKVRLDEERRRNGRHQRGRKWEEKQVRREEKGGGEGRRYVRVNKEQETKIFKHEGSVH